MTIGDMVVKLGLDPSGLNKGVSESRGILSRLGGSLASAALSGAGFAAGFMSLNAIASGAKWGISLAAEAEQAKVAFTTLLGSGEAAEQMLAGLTQFAADTPFDMPELKTAARQLAAFGVEADQIVPQLKMIGDIASGTGQPIAELAELYGKAKVQGRLFGEDINQLTGRGIPIISSLAEQFGVAESEVKKLVEQGKVGFPELQRAFQSMTGEGGRFTGMMEAQSKTLAGVWGAFTDNAAMITADFFTYLSKAWNFTGLVNQAADWMRETVSFVQDGVTLIGWSFENIGTLAEYGLKRATLSVVQFGGEVSHFFTGTLPTLFSWFGENWRDIFSTAGNFVKTVFENMGENIARIMTSIWEFIWSGGRKSLSLAWTPLLDGFQSTVAQLPDIPQRAIGQLEQSLLDETNRLGNMIGDGLGQAMMESWDNAKAVATPSGAMAMLSPEAGGVTATGAAGATSGPVTARQGSVEAYKLINNAFNNQQSAAESRAQKIAERQLAEVKKTNELLLRVVEGVSDGSSPEEVDI